MLVRARSIEPRDETEEPARLCWFLRLENEPLPMTVTPLIALMLLRTGSLRPLWPYWLLYLLRSSSSSSMTASSSSSSSSSLSASSPSEIWNSAAFMALRDDTAGATPATAWLTAVMGILACSSCCFSKGEVQDQDAGDLDSDGEGEVGTVEGRLLPLPPLLLPVSELSRDRLLAVLLPPWTLPIAASCRSSCSLLHGVAMLLPNAEAGCCGLAAPGRAYGISSGLLSFFPLEPDHPN